MLKDINNMTDEEKLNSVLFGNCLAVYCANTDKKNYKQYKLGNISKLTNDELIDMKVLDLLYSLGYPNNELGTYLYKEVICELYRYINDNFDELTMVEYEYIIKDLNNAYSQFYFNQARNILEMGVTSFHLYIQDTINKIDENKIDKELSKKVYGPNPVEFNYGIQALQLTGYLLNKYSYDNVENYHKPKIKKLSNIRDNVILK